MKNKWLVPSVLGFISGMIVMCLLIVIIGVLYQPNIKYNNNIEPSKVIQATSEFTPLVTSTISSKVVLLPSSTPVPSITPIPSMTYGLPILSTVNPSMISEKTEGTYLVNIEISPGLWRATGGDCYSVTKNKNGDPLDMKSGINSIITIKDDDFQVEFVNYPGQCTWKYLGK